MYLLNAGVCCTVDATPWKYKAKSTQLKLPPQFPFLWVFFCWSKTPWDSILTNNNNGSVVCPLPPPLHHVHQLHQSVGWRWNLGGFGWGAVVNIYQHAMFVLSMLVIIWCWWSFWWTPCSPVASTSAGRAGKSWRELSPQPSAPSETRSSCWSWRSTI